MTVRDDHGLSSMVLLTKICVPTLLAKDGRSSARHLKIEAKSSTRETAKKLVHNLQVFPRNFPVILESEIVIFCYCNGPGPQTK